MLVLFSIIDSWRFGRRESVRYYCDRVQKFDLPAASEINTASRLRAVMHYKVIASSGCVLLPYCYFGSN
uniref:Uncharacterized protein n=1 Tax=Hyaloperonospora arabidopsidis (strain Emoy2) TaxID=559515 RepID=M4C0S8_HYAAE